MSNTQEEKINPCTRKSYFRKNDEMIINPITKRYYSRNVIEYLQYIKGNSPYGKEAILPAAQKNIENDIYNKLENSQVLLLTGHTGSGKTVLVPYYVLKYFIKKGSQKKVVCTEPKRMAARKPASHVSNCIIGANIGQEVGYKFKLESKISNKTRLQFVTEDTLKQECIDDENLNEYDAVIIDEAHERKISTDFLFFFVSNILRNMKRPNFRVVIMSADAQMPKFRNYFEKFGITTSDIKIEGVSKPTVPSPTEPDKWGDYLLSKGVGREYVKEAIKIIVRIVNNDKTLPHNSFFEKYKEQIKEQDILVFVTSLPEMETGCKLLQEALGKERVAINPKPNQKLDKDVGCFTLSAQINSEDQDIIIEPNHKSLGIKRKVIFSTNVAEASITINTIAFVIDTGRAQETRYEPERDRKTLETYFITKAQVKQRIGRVGRVMPGATYFVYTKEEYDSMDDYRIPEIHTSSLSDNILSIMLVNKYSSFDSMYKLTDFLLDAPKDNVLYSSQDKLAHLSCIDDDGIITPIGKIIATISKGIEIARSLVYSVAYECLPHIIVLYLMMGVSTKVQDFLILDNGDLSPENRNILIDKEGDIYTLIKIFLRYRLIRDPLQSVYNDKVNYFTKIYDRNDTNYDIQLEKYKNDILNVPLVIECKKYQLNHEKLNEVYENFESLYENIKKIDQEYNLKSALRKKDCVRYKNPFYKWQWQGRPLNTNIERRIDNPKYRENILRSILAGNFMNIAIKEKNNYIDLKNEDNIHIGKRKDNILYNPLVKNSKKFIVFLERFAPQKQNSAVLSQGFDDPTLFLEPGLVYYHNKKYNNGLLKSKRKEWLNIMSTYDHKLKEYGYYYFK